MKDYEKEHLFKHAKALLDKMDDEELTWNPLDKEQAGAWICGRYYEVMALIMCFGLNIDYLLWERKQDDLSWEEFLND